MASKFIHLHVHSHYSLLNALPQIDALVKRAKEYGMPALALTDNGNLYGAIEFYKTCKKEGIKPIIGIDAYLAPRTRFQKEHKIDNKWTRLILLAKNDAGYKNLIKLVTASHLEGFYYKPRIDKELLEQLKDNLLCISPSFNSDITQALRAKDLDKAKALVSYYKKLFGPDSFYLEITHHPEVDMHQSTISEVIELGRETNTPIVAAHDVYYLDQDDKKARDTLLSIQGHDVSERNLTDEEENFSFINGETAEKYFKKNPEAIENTAKIADICNLEITLGKWFFPDYKVAENTTHDKELQKLVLAGIKKRNVEETPVIKERIEYELKVIKDKGYAKYFLVVADLLNYAHAHDILTTIRGSVAGSIVTYLAGITNVNPIEYKLPFERFLNPERPSAPDIDMDFADNRRDEVINYTREKYGHDKVAQIGTFGTMMARGAVRDVARALGHPYAVGDQIAKIIPMGSQGFPMTIEHAMEITPDLKKLYKENRDVGDIIDTAIKIEGCARHISVHAAGVVIAPTALTDYVPIQYDPKGEGKLITQYDMHSVGEDGVGLLKFDFLGIRNLSILADAVTLVKKIEGVVVDIENIPLDDKKTFEMLARGETIGLFQLNGTGMTRFLKELKPSTIHDINAMVALYRPGPMESIPQYIERKHNSRLIQYIDPRLKDILDQSYGVITYQDDVMMTAIKLAGYSWLEADKLRKAMGKKIPAEMEAQKGKLIEGLVKNGLSKEKSEQLWKLIEPFAAYGFNKCVTGDTQIIDSDTGEVISVEELYESDHHCNVYTLSSNQKLTTAPIKAIMQNGVKQIYEVRTRSGRTLRATINHPLYTISGWKTVKKLGAGDRIGVARRIPQPLSPQYISPHYMAVLGYLLSEGNLCHPHGIYYYSTQEDEIDDFIKHVSKFDNVKITIDRSKSAASIYVGQINQKKGNSLMDWIRTLGLAGKRATEKFIPKEIYTLDNATLALFLGKLWQGDGCVNVPGEQLYYATSSLKMAGDLQHLLLRFGILSALHRKQFKYRGSFKPGFTVVISHRDNIKIFGSTIGKNLIGLKKKQCVELLMRAQNVEQMWGSYPARGTKDIIPLAIITHIREEMIKEGMSTKVFAEKANIAIRLLFQDKKKKGYQRSLLRTMAHTLQSNSLLAHAESDIYWDEIVSITLCGKEMTYDLTVPPHHNFLANDFIVHNSHAASYGRVAYKTAYMKANFPAIYMSAVLTAESGNMETIAEVIVECKHMGIEVLAPNINESYGGFTVIKNEANRSKDKIRFGLFTIKNFGEGIGSTIIADRKKNGNFKSLADFLTRIKDKNLNKKSLEALIKSGALDEFGERGHMLGNLELLLNYHKEHAMGNETHSSLFGMLSTTSTLDDLKLAPSPTATTEEKLAWEKELLGLFLSGHPLDKHKDKLSKVEMNIATVKATVMEGMTTAVYGILEEAKQFLTKKGDTMMFLKISDFSDSIEAVVFPRTYLEYKNLLTPDNCIAVKGRFSKRNGTQSIIVEKAKAL